MNPKPIEHANTPDLALALPALRRARKRAEQIAMLLRGANLKAPAYSVKWQDEPAAATGVDDHLSRRVVVIVRRP